MEDTINTEHKNYQAIYGLIFIVIIAAIIIATSVMDYKNKGALTNNSINLSKNIPSATTQANKKYLYKDGSYSADGTYMIHSGTEAIGVMIKLKNDIIIDSAVTEKPTDPISKQYQDIFAANYKQYVIGKSISSVKLDRVSTSSLTPMGFNNALEMIKTKAKG